LHVGGARTALFNWLFARQQKGVFILRIEDSDLKRNQPELIEIILSELRWLGLDWDEGPFRQSERFEIYRAHARTLLASGAAYPAPSPEGTGEAVIYRVGEGTTIFPDLIRGEIAISSEEIKDIVLIKSDGTPTYNFACVVDDHEMGISHVIRGEDHIPNTPKQILLYRALGWPLPAFAHLPLILGADKAPLSKRHGATSLSAFRDAGYLAPALLNYLALLGWAPGDDREIFSSDELIRAFTLERVNKSAAVFDYQKLSWVNGNYLPQLSTIEFAALARPHLGQAGIGEATDDLLGKVFRLLGQRMKTVADLVDQGDYFFRPPREYRPEAVAKFWKGPLAGEILSREREILSRTEPFAAGAMEAPIRSLMAELGLKGGQVMGPLRVALTGKTDSPGVFEIMEILGREEALSRLDRALATLRSGAGI
jgi:glutamyl-tRNA synthetase